MFIGGQVATPDRASEHVYVTVTLVLFQPAAFGAGVAVELMVGAVLSIFTVSLAVAVFPATSVAVPFTTWFAPWPVSVVGPLQDFTPEVASVHVKLTVTLVLFQLKLSAAGVWPGVIVGAVLSRLIVTDVEAVFPAKSTAVPLTTWPAPSVLTVTGGVHDAMPEVLSAQVNVTVTLVLFHPAPLGPGLADAVMVGKSLSTPVMVTVTELPTPPRTVTLIVLLRESVTVWVTLGFVWFTTVFPFRTIKGLAFAVPVTTRVYVVAVL